MPLRSSAPEGEQPPAPFPPPPTEDGFQDYVVLWLLAFNHWHTTVDTKLSTLEARTRDIRLILIGTILTALAAIFDAVLRVSGR